MNKIFNVGQLMGVIQRERKVVFTHGAFDLLHKGHLYLLENSLNFGGKLIVGVDSDKNVLRYKGAKPYFGERYRMELISKLDFVDYVVFLDPKVPRDYYLRLYLSLKPNVVTYGRNFSYAGKLEKDCRLLGIKTGWLPMNKSWGSTYYRNKIRHNYVKDL